MGQSYLIKSMRPQTPGCLLTLLFLYMFAIVIFLWYLAQWEWMWGDPYCLYAVCLSHGNITIYWTFLYVDCLEGDPSLSCTA